MKTVPKPCVCTSVRRVSRSLARVYDRALAPAGLNTTQFAVLRAIERSENESMARIAEGLSMDRTSFYRSLAPLTRAGWVMVTARGRGPARQVALTDKGRRVLAHAAEHWEAIQVSVIDRFGRAAWRDLVAELDRLTACLPSELTGHE